MYTALTNGIIITEQGLVHGHALLLEDDVIAGLTPDDRLSTLRLDAVEDTQGPVYSARLHRHPFGYDRGHRFPPPLLHDGF